MPGRPAISLSTSWRVFSQKEHRSTWPRPLPPLVVRLRLILPLVGLRSLRSESSSLGLLIFLIPEGLDHFVHQPVFRRLLRRHEEVPQRVLLDALDGLARVLRQDLLQGLLVALDLLGLDLDVERRPHGTTPRLVDHH